MRIRRGIQVQISGFRTLGLRIVPLQGSIRVPLKGSIRGPFRFYRGFRVQGLGLVYWVWGSGFKV